MDPNPSALFVCTLTVWAKVPVTVNSAMEGFLFQFYDRCGPGCQHAMPAPAGMAKQGSETRQE